MPENSLKYFNNSYFLLFNSNFTKEEIIRNEVLRMEVRLNTKKKIKEMLIESGCNPKATTFQGLFHKELSKRVLNHFWEKHITPSLNILLLAEEDPQELFYKAKSLGLTENKVLQVIGGLQIVKNNGIRALKNILASKTFYRLKQELSQFNEKENYLYSVFNGVKLDLQNMQSVKMEGLLRK